MGYKGGMFVKETIVFNTDDILSLISKEYYNNYCLFIIPSGITDTESVINYYIIDCKEEDLYSENMILELFDNKTEAEKRFSKFINANNKYGCLCAICYYQGDVIYTNE